MDFLQSIVTAKILFILGIINLLTGALVTLSCRCIPTRRITGKLMQYKAYSRFYKYHCYIWPIFWVSVVVHAILAIGYFGMPF